MVKFGSGLLLFANFLKSGLITFIYSCIQLLGNDIDQLSRDIFHELFKRSFSRSERSGLAHFPIIIDIISVVMSAAQIY